MYSWQHWSNLVIWWSIHFFVAEKQPQPTTIAAVALTNKNNLWPQSTCSNHQWLQPLIIRSRLLPPQWLSLPLPPIQLLNYRLCPLALPTLPPYFPPIHAILLWRHVLAVFNNNFSVIKFNVQESLQMPWRWRRPYYIPNRRYNWYLATDPLCILQRLQIKGEYNLKLSYKCKAPKMR